MRLPFRDHPSYRASFFFLGLCLWIGSDRIGSGGDYDVPLMPVVCLPCPFCMLCVLFVVGDGGVVVMGIHDMQVPLEPRQQYPVRGAEHPRESGAAGCGLSTAAPIHHRRLPQRSGHLHPTAGARADPSGWW